YAARVAPEADISIERAQRGKALRVLGYGEPTTVGTGTADVGRRLSFPITLPDGCVRLDVVGGRPLAGITADVWDASSNLIASGTAGGGPAPFAWGEGGGARLAVGAPGPPRPLALRAGPRQTPHPPPPAPPPPAG